MAKTDSIRPCAGCGKQLVCAALGRPLKWCPECRAQAARDNAARTRLRNRAPESIRPCGFCGTKLSSDDARRVYCSVACRRAQASKLGRLNPQPKKTEQCSIEGCAQLQQAKSLCSKHYNRQLKYGDPLKTLRPRGIATPPCVVCAKPLLRRHVHKGSRTCSFECSGKLRTLEIAAKRASSQGPCQGCGTPLTRKIRVNDSGRYCGRECWETTLATIASERKALRAIGDKRRVERQALLDRLAAPLLAEIAALKRIARYVEKPRLTKRPCRVCSVLTIGVGEMQRSCKGCTAERLKAARRRTRQGQAYKAGKLKSKSIRRAREAIEAEAVIPYVVFSRAGWKCQLCGVDTPRKLRGTYEPNAPELDHIVPLSKGGGHTWANVQCACRQCNARKSDKLAA